MREQIAALWNQIGGRAYLVPALLIAVSLAGCIGPNSVPAQGVTAPTRAAEIPTPVPTLAKPTPIPSNTFKHVFIIVMENRDYGEIIGSKVVAPGVILYDYRNLGLCAGMTDARYTTTTEVYPDSPRATPEQCNAAQVAAVNAAIGFALAGG